MLELIELLCLKLALLLLLEEALLEVVLSLFELDQLALMLGRVIGEWLDLLLLNLLQHLSDLVELLLLLLEVLEDLEDVLLMDLLLAAELKELLTLLHLMQNVLAGGSAGAGGADADRGRIRCRSTGVIVANRRRCVRSCAEVSKRSSILVFADHH